MQWDFETSPEVILLKKAPCLQLKYDETIKLPYCLRHFFYVLVKSLCLIIKFHPNSIISIHV